MEISTINPYVRVFVAQVKGRGALVLACLLLQLYFASFSYHFICFSASGCIQMSLFTIFVRSGSIL